MPRNPDEQALIERFSRTYAHLSSSDTMLEIERAVCGCDYGCTSWTTKDETRQIVELLDLKPGRRLLDIGSGSGWPGLYLAQVSGCDSVLTDLPFEGLKVAKQRAQKDGLNDTCQIAQADGTALPFQEASFDAIYHSDVLCCLVEKQAVLEQCRQVIAADGKMVFSVILIAPDLSAADYRQAAAGGPTFIETDTPYPDMLEQTGWQITEHIDQTADYAETFAKMFELEKANKDEFVRVHGEEGATSLLERRQATLDALQKNFLRRELFGVVAKG
ncbi:MAG: methyltransferase domain-containing protein [Proteobacteria bacterium]|nr:methyltransferase domain-containing protein [Pseudomonadota bacterium]MDA1023687.1 methyltransferase domain-containing protein [Pseudomonadota bacterium]